jgi:long-chain acyl-CoA synthetase
LFLPIVFAHRFGGCCGRKTVVLANAMNPTTLLDQPFGTTAGMIRAFAAQQPSHPALIHHDRQVSFAELDAMMDRVAVALQRDGLQVGDVIAVCAATSIEYSVVYLGALRAGAVVAPLAPSSTAESLATMLDDAGARLRE